MKRTISTIVLFVLLILTVVAIQKLDTAKTSALGQAQVARRSTN